MNKTLMIFLIAGIIIVSLSIGYWLVLKPSEFDSCYNKCLASGINGRSCVPICSGNSN